MGSEMCIRDRCTLNHFSKKVIYQDTGHAQREEDSTELETIPCTYSDATKAEERADQLSPGTASFLLFQK